MLDNSLKAQLKGFLERLVAPIELVASLDQSAKSQELHQLLTEISELSDQVRLREDGSDPRRPSFSVGRLDQPARIRFAGLPLGHEFTSLVLALLQASGYPPKISDEQAARIAALRGRHRFESYVSLSCHNCPDVVQALNVLAALNPDIEHVMIDGALFQDEVDARQVLAVPTLYLDGEPFGSGRMTLDELIARLDEGSAVREAERLSGQPPYELLVVGGGPAAAAAAIYAARKGVRTGVVAERFGGQLLDTLAIENLIAVAHTEGPTLARTLEAHLRQHQVDIIDLQRADALIPGAPGGYHSLKLYSGAELRAKSLIIATGARWRELNVPGEREYRGKGVAYCPHCDGPLFKGKRVAVVGGGNSGVEAAIDLAGIVSQVTLIEFDSTLRADAVLQEKLRSLPNVSVITRAQSREISGEAGRVNGLLYTDRATGQSRQIALEGVFVQIGLLPNTDWLKGVVELSRSGEIIVDARGQTNVAGVFGAGDCTTVPYKQIVIAMGEGAKASLTAFDYLIRTSAPA